MKPNIKKLLILNAPYLLFVYLFDKVGQAVRLSPGADLSGKLVSIGSGFSAAFSNALPSFNPMDLLIGIVGAVVIRLSFSKIEGRHGTYALIDKGENRDKEIKKPRPSVRAQLAADKKTAAPKKSAAKRKNHDLEV